MSWLTKFVEAVSVWATWFFGEKHQAKRGEAAKDKAAAEAADAVREKDVDKVNEILRRNLAYPLIAFVTCLSMCATTPGCATSKPPVYIPAEDKVYPVVLDGKAGWFVPDRVFEKMVSEIAKENK